MLVPECIQCASQLLKTQPRPAQSAARAWSWRLLRGTRLLLRWKDTPTFVASAIKLEPTCCRPNRLPVMRPRALIDTAKACIRLFFPKAVALIFQPAKDP